MPFAGWVIVEVMPQHQAESVFTLGVLAVDCINVAAVQPPSQLNHV